VNWPAQCAAIIPCLNEAATIASVVRGVQAHLPSVIVVDDGSCDGTAASVRELGVRLVQQPRSRGKGAALRMGWEAAHQGGFDWVLMLDGDGQHAPEDIPYFFIAAETTGARLIIGNRMDHAEAMPWIRRAANRWMSRRLSRLAEVELPDSQCGFRLAHLPTLRSLNLQTTQFEIESEMSVAFARAGHKVAFVPVQVRYGTESSKISPIRDTWRWLRWWNQMQRQYGR
jgi:glycosyltransferase involved in cell wall biosynthesis